MTSLPLFRGFAVAAPSMFCFPTPMSDAVSQKSDRVAHKSSGLLTSRDSDVRIVRSRAALQAALLALLEEKSFERVTVRDICGQSGVHYATFFRHYPSKEALLDAIAAEQMVRLVELTMPVRAAADDHSGFLALCRYVDEYRSLWTTLLTGGASQTMRAELLRQCRRIATEVGPMNSWLPSDLGTVCAASLITETLAWWLAEPTGVHSVEQVADVLTRLLGTAILAPD